jgi:formate hydrogenlyase subunit 6/NADH:ubiquinone oxidoreductase subunit I
VDRPCDIACMLCEDICPVSTIDHTEITSATNGNQSPYHR